MLVEGVLTARTGRRRVLGAAARKPPPVPGVCEERGTPLVGKQRVALVRRDVGMRAIGAVGPAGVCRSVQAGEGCAASGGKESGAAATA